MLTIVAHQGSAGPHSELWTHWNAEPAMLLGLGVGAWAYHRGASRRRQSHPGRDRAFWAGMLTVLVALVSPVDVLAGDLASAHMVQHVLLVVVAAPLLAHAAPLPTVFRGVPSRQRARLGHVRRLVRRQWLFEAIRRPGAAWLLHAATLWFWHASGPYGGALEDDFVHAAEHLTFLLTAVLFWSSVLRPVGRPEISDGYRALLVFTMAMQSVFLSLLLTFATSPWYPGYVASAGAWGLDPLADQQLAGVIMWVPAGFVYLGVGIALVTRWIRSGDSAAGAIGDTDWADHSRPPLRPLQR